MPKIFCKFFIEPLLRFFCHINTIMADYISTLPWNDPYNPWPAYSQYTLSASNIPNIIVSLTYFQPNMLDDLCISFENNNTALFGSNDEYGNFFQWNVVGTGTQGDYYYNSPTAIKNPVKADSWCCPINKIIITPVLSAITPWERRRRRYMGY